MGINEVDVFDTLEEQPSEQEHAEETEKLEDVEEEVEESQASDEEEYPDESDEEVVEEEEEEEAERLYAGRFKSVEDLEKSYKSLQSQLTPILQQLRNKQEGQPIVPAAVNAQGVPNELANSPEFQQIAATNPAMAAQIVANYIQQKQQQQITQVMSPVQRQIKDMEIKMEVLNLRASLPDFDEFAPELPVVFNENPWLWNTNEPVKTAYKLLKADKLTASSEEVTKARKAAAEEVRKQKKAAGAEKQKGKRHTKKVTPEEQIANDIIGVTQKKNAFL